MNRGGDELVYRWHCTRCTRVLNRDLRPARAGIDMEMYSSDRTVAAKLCTECEGTPVPSVEDQIRAVFAGMTF